MNLELFIKKSFEIGLALLSKDTLTKEESHFLGLLDSFEKWILKNGADDKALF